MVEDYFLIFNYLGAPKKYYGATIPEIAAVLSIMLISLALDQAAVGFMVAIVTFKLIRAVSQAVRLIVWKRCCYFYLHDFLIQQRFLL